MAPNKTTSFTLEALQMMFRRFALRTLFFLSLLLLVGTLWFFRNTWMLVFLAIVLAVGISIPVSYLRRLGLPRAVAVAVSLFGSAFVAFALCFWLFPSLASEFGALLTRIPDIANRLTRLYLQVRQDNAWLAELLPPLTERFDARSYSPERIQELFNRAVSAGLPVLVSGGGLVASLMTNLFLVVMLVIFLLAEPKTYVKGLLYLIPVRHHGQTLALLSVLYHTLRTWFSTLLISISITATLVWLVLGSLGMPNVLVVAVFAGLATFVPNIGVVLPLIPISVFILVSEPGRWPVMVLAYLAIQLIESNILTPSIVRRQLSIPPAATLVAQILAAAIFGILGILLAVPLVAVLTTAVREVYSYGMLGLRGRQVRVHLPDPTPHARDTRLPQRTTVLVQRLNPRDNRRSSDKPPPTK